MATNGRIPFISRDGCEEMPPPYQFRGLKIRSFPLRADPTKLEAVCDRFLNLAPADRLHYKPLGGLVFLQVATYSYLACQDSPWSGWGWFEENEISFNMLVCRGHTRNGKWHPEEIAYFLPYIFVDNPWAIATGREVFGFPKTASRFAIPQDVNSTDPIRVETMVFDKYAPNTQLQNRPLVEIEQVPGSTKEPARTFDHLDGAWHELKSIFFGRDGFLHPFNYELLQEVIRTFHHQTISMVNLKQFRDVADPTTACFQAITNAKMKIQEYKHGGLMPAAYNVKLHRYDSLPIADAMGLKMDAEGKQEVDLAFWLDFDCTVGDAENLYVVDPQRPGRADRPGRIIEPPSPDRPADA